MTSRDDTLMTQLTASVQFLYLVAAILLRMHLLRVPDKEERRDPWISVVTQKSFVKRNRFG